MHARAHRISRIERLASLAAAISVTALTALLVLAAPGRTFLSASPSAPPLGIRHMSERVVYLIPHAPVPVIPPTRQAARSPARETTPPPRDTASVAGPVAGAIRAPDTMATSEIATRETDSSHATTATRAAGTATSFHHISPPIRFDSALRATSDSIAVRLATGRLKPPPLTQAEIDARWREEAFEVAAARGAGEPVRRTMAGGSIAVPLPFGGPSRKQRERDRAIGAELSAARALRQQRVDSVVAARQRRADSLARLADSLRPGSRPRP